MQCQRCGSTLYLDRRSVNDALMQGYAGGRLFCLCGWDTWQLTYIPRPELVIEPKRPRYHREAWEHVCVTCQVPFLSKAPNAQRDAECAKAARAARAKVNWKNHMARKRAAQRAVAVA